VRETIPIQFVATSLKHGTYLPYSHLDGEPGKLKDYVDEVMEYV